MATTHLEATHFVPILPGQTIEAEIDAAELYGMISLLPCRYGLTPKIDVEASGSNTVRAVWSMPYADLNSTKLSGKSVAFASNALTMYIDGDQAKTVSYAAHTLAQKRTDLSTNGCSGQRSAAVQTALSNCADLANNAASAAAAGYQLREYFKSSSSSVPNAVSARFAAVAKECASTNRGGTETSCAGTFLLPVRIGIN